MAETLTPNPISNPNNNKPPIVAPTTPFFLASNDDQLERAAARAARAAAFRRKPVEIVPPRNSLSSDSCLDRHQIMELFHNCVKLASENKITQKNTWELKLIDHLSEIIKVEEENNNAATNFQRASCTLETGVKIYAVRVDAWHADAYRVLGGISRTGLGDEHEFSIGGTRTCIARNGKKSVKETERKVSPLSTVESSFEALNIKKFDVAFTVDPLYHQTSAQFDEGGAKGLLLCNLGVYGGCRVLFDSQEVPAECISSTNGSTSSNLVDVFFAKEHIELMAANLHQNQDISPSLRVLVKQIDELRFPSRVPDGTESIINENIIDTNKVDKKFYGATGATEDIGAQIYDSSFDYNEVWSADNDHDVTISDEDVDMGIPTMQNYTEDTVQYMPLVGDSFENVGSLFCRGLGYESARNAWAGPDHWKYSKPNGPESISVHDSRLDGACKRPKSKSSWASDIDFIKNLDDKVPDIFVPVKNPKSLLLPTRKVPFPNKLPEDWHYQPEDLVKLFLLPHVMCLGKIRKVSGSLLQGDDVTFPSWDHESTVYGSCDDNFIHRDTEEDILVSEPRRVDKIEVEYDETSKQVDIHVLKKTLWTLMQGSMQTPEVMHADGISFRHILTTFPDDCKASVTRDISPHLCFICLLHLANEHELTIIGCPNFDDLSIHLPVACEDIGEVIQASS
ncbi:condensin complex subunit 2 isoform X1 [Beta vulgaris subsp. vulgaris]|uniref:condensin complex subunit 2 isoform X1 n=1 Tax=Beta vulgaris subsp. vulgaris TaxID=3555 RepID=UPI002036B3A9|nr:condensin complex subunit 2 isoform X1 [Beta vulgaris subsp. vulgaris]